MSRPPPAARRAVAAGALVGILALFFAPALLGDGQFLFRDDGRMHHPVKQFVAAELRSGRVAQWNPYSGLGTPVVACAADAPLHPFNLLFLALPFEAAFKAWILLSFVVAAFGARAWARALGASDAGALVAGIAFALSGFLVSASDNLSFLTTLAAAPWLLAAGLRAAERASPGRLAVVGVASLLCAAAGDPEGWGIAVALLAIQPGLLAPAGERRRAAGRGALAVAVAVAFAAPVVLPVIAWLPHSMRVDGPDATLGKWDLDAVRLAELAIPGLLDDARRGAVVRTLYAAVTGGDGPTLPWAASLYAGATVLALAARAAAPGDVAGSALARRARLLLTGAVAFTWAAMGVHAGFAAVAHALPIVRSLRYWEKLAAWPALLLAGAAGLGLDRALRERTRALPAIAGALATALVATGALAAASPGAVAWALGGLERDVAAVVAANVARGALAAGVVAAVLAIVAHAMERGRLGRLAPTALVALVALDLASANAGAYYLSPPGIVRPDSDLARWVAGRPGLPRVVTKFGVTPSRWPELPEFEAAWRWGAATLAPAWNVAARVGNLGSYSSMPARRLTHLQNDAGPGRLAPVAGMWGFPYAVVPRDPTLASRIGLAAPPEILFADPTLPAFVVGIPHRPRAYLAREVSSSDEAGAYAFVRAPGAAEGSRTVVEAPLPPGLGTGGGTVRISRDEPDRVELDVSAAAPSLLVLNDQDAPGWTATVDGVAAPIVTANYLARGVFVRAGSHRVAFSYRTPGLAAGAAVAVLAAGALAAWKVLRDRRRAGGDAGLAQERAA